MVRRIKALACGLVVAATVPFAAANAAVSLTGYTLYGINGSGQLYKYDFSTGTSTTIGAVKLASNNTALTGVKAAAYIPRHSNLFAFWTDPSDGMTKMLLIGLADGKAKIAGPSLGACPITAATAGEVVAPPTLSSSQLTPIADVQQHHIYAVQIGLTVNGKMNINPNNSPDNEFTLTKPDGTSFSRDQLAAKDIVLDANGNYYFGPAAQIRVKPKGVGTQNSLNVGGQPVTIQNSNVYLITGQPQVTARVYNDKLNPQGKAMGKWWLEIGTGVGTLQDLGTSGTSVAGTTSSGTEFGQLISVDPSNGTSQQIMIVHGNYDELAAQPGGTTLYATWGQNVYKIDLVNKTETLVGAITAHDAHSLEFAGDTLLGFSGTDHTLYTVNPTTGSSSVTGVNLGTDDIKGAVFQRNPDVEAAYPAQD